MLVIARDGRRSPPDVLTGALFVGGLCAIWIARHVPSNLSHDAEIYVGYALAGLNPGGIGRDIFFAFDGQSQFSLFPSLLRLLISSLGVSTTTALVSVFASLCHIAAAISLVSKLPIPTDCRKLALIGLALLPSSYGADNILHYAEAMVTPRPFAEAAAIAALGFIIERRIAPAAAFMTLSAILHPLMALPAAGVAFALAAANERRLLLVLPAGAAVLLAASVAGLGPAGRLLDLIDDEWLAILQVRNFYLFPTLWAFDDWVRLATQLATVAAAASFVQGRLRAALIAGAGIAVAGVLTSIVLGDLIPTVLVTQLQLWRAQWLLAYFAALSFALCVHGFASQKGPGAVFKIAVLAIAWIGLPLPLISFMGLSLLGLAILIEHKGGRMIHMREARVAAIIAALVAIAFLIMYILVALHPTGPGPMRLRWTTEALVKTLTIPVLGVLAYALLSGGRNWRRTARILPLLFLPLTISACMGGIPSDRYLEYRTQHVLDAASAKRAAGGAEGAVWIHDESASKWKLEGAEKWLLSRQAQWFDPVQGAASVFSRDLAIEWNRRAMLLIESGIAPPSVRTTDAAGADDGHWSVEPERLMRLCRAQGGPTAIIVQSKAAADDRLTLKVHQCDAADRRS